jgi:hypothetical protein
MLGRITALDADGVGRIVLEDGRELRFGASGCKGFSPVLTARVSVVEIGPHPLGGEKAIEVHAAPGSEAELDALHEARAAELAPSKSAQELADEAAREALVMGKLTVLLAEPAPMDRAGQRALLADLLPPGTELTFVVHLVQFRVHEQLVMAAFGPAPYPRAVCDLSACDEDFDVGQGFVSFLWDPSLVERMLPMLNPEVRAAMRERLDGVRAFLADTAERLAARSVGLVLHEQRNRVRPCVQAMAVT